MTGLMRASFPRQGRASLSAQIDLIFLPCVPMVVTLLTWRTGESRDMRGGEGEVADGVGEESLSPSEDYSHPSLIVPSPTLARHFPNLAPTFYPPITFCQAQPNLTCYHVIPHISRWVGGRSCICREIKRTGLRSSSFQSLVVESERLSFPTTAN